MTATQQRPAAADTAALTVEGMSIRFGDRVLVDDLSFTIGRGERVGLIGESGSGKSVTSLAVMGLLPETLSATGSVRVGPFRAGALSRAPPPGSSARRCPGR